MLRAVLLLSFVLISSAKIGLPDISYDENLVDDEEFLKSDPVWVLKLHSQWEMKLNPATPDEEEEFEDIAGPMIENYKRRQALRKVSPRPQVRVDETNAVGKEDIFKLLNKFALYTKKEPDAYITESNDDSPSIVLYFSGPYTSLMVEVGNKLWHYFIDPPSSLPSWFYEAHTQLTSDLSSGHTSDSVAIPEEVKQRFYVELLDLLHTLLSYPL